MKPKVESYIKSRRWQRKTLTPLARKQRALSVKATRGLHRVLGTGVRGIDSGVKSKALEVRARKKLGLSEFNGRARVATAPRNTPWNRKGK